MEDIMYSINRLLSITIGNNRSYFDVQYVNIAMLVWGCVFCLIAGVGMILSKNFDRRKRLWMILLQFATAVLLLSDATACMFLTIVGFFNDVPFLITIVCECKHRRAHRVCRVCRCIVCSFM